MAMRGKGQRYRIIVSAAFGLTPLALYGVGHIFGSATLALIVLGAVFAVVCYTCPAWCD